MKTAKYYFNVDASGEDKEIRSVTKSKEDVYTECEQLKGYVKVDEFEKDKSEFIMQIMRFFFVVLFNRLTNYDITLCSKFYISF